MSEAKQELLRRMLLLAAKARLHIHAHLVTNETGSGMWYQEVQTCSPEGNPGGLLSELSGD